MHRPLLASVCVFALAIVPLAPRAATAQGERSQQPSGSGAAIKTHDDLQSPTLPPLPAGMTIATIVEGDSIFHGKGNCAACHGTEGQGLPALGDAITAALNWAQPEWTSIDSLIDNGIPQVLTRSPIQMPPRGGRSDLTREEVRRVAAYVWAISQTRGEPWAGGHTSHTTGESAAIAPSTVQTAGRPVPPNPAKPRRPRPDHE